jgi:hypothetical protein
VKSDSHRKLVYLADRKRCPTAPYMNPSPDRNFMTGRRCAPPDPRTADIPPEERESCIDYGRSRLYRPVRLANAGCIFGPDFA